MIFSRSFIMAPGVVDAARWLSAEAAQMTSRNAPMDAMDFSPPVHAFTHAPAFAQVHCNMLAALLPKAGREQPRQLGGIFVGLQLFQRIQGWKQAAF